jgi:secretion/DNA translocation related CpaE-like protein
VSVVSTRTELHSAIARLAALAGVPVEVVADSSRLRALWQRPGLLVLGGDMCGPVADIDLPRRDDVAVVTTGVPDTTVWQGAVAVGAIRLFVLPTDERALIDLIAVSAESKPVAHSTIAVVGGTGGAGASTFAAALALSSARTRPTVLIDGDRLGGGLDVLLGAEHVTGARWPDLAGAQGRLSAASFSEALLMVDGLAVLSWDRGGATELGAEAPAAVIDAAARGFACTVVDLPRHGDAATTVFTGAADLAVIVVPATVRATAASAAVAAGLAGHCGRLRLVVRDAVGGRLTAAEVGDALGLPLIATLTSEPAVSAAAERGEPPSRRRGSLSDACAAVLADAVPQSIAA